MLISNSVIIGLSLSVIIFSNSPFFREEKIEKGQMLCPDIQKELNECWSISDSKIHLTQLERTHIYRNAHKISKRGV